MKKIFILILLAAIISVLLSTFLHCSSDKETVNTLFSVSSVLFSVGICLIVTIVPNGVKNKGYIRRIETSLDRVRNCFLVEFFIITAVHLIALEYTSYLTFSVDLSSFQILFDPVTADAVLISLSFVYYSLNFLYIQELNRDIFKALNEQTKEA